MNALWVALGVVGGCVYFVIGLLIADTYDGDIEVFLWPVLLPFLLVLVWIPRWRVLRRCNKLGHQWQHAYIGAAWNPQFIGDCEQCRRCRRYRPTERSLMHGFRR